MPSAVPSALERVPLYPQEAAAPKATVCVTGASGYAAGSVVERLLLSGHTVHATVRDPSKQDAVAHLKALPGAAERLKLFAADLMQPGSFDAAVAGCDCVMHTASPFLVQVKPGEERRRLIDPAVKGVENVLAAVDKAPSVQRVVLTSSVAAMLSNADEHGKGALISERHWNATASERVTPYNFSKKEAERRAWELAKAQSRWSLVVINPALILGPPLSSRTDSVSVELLVRILGGELYPAAPWSGLGWVDVRDVAAAHCLAMVHPGAHGRNICVASTVMMHELCHEVAGLYPGFRPPRFFAPKWLLWLVGPYVGLSRDNVANTVGYVPKFDNSKIQRELGFKFLDLKTSLHDMVEDLIARGLAKRPTKK